MAGSVEREGTLSSTHLLFAPDGASLSNTHEHVRQYDRFKSPSTRLRQLRAAVVSQTSQMCVDAECWDVRNARVAVCGWRLLR